MDYYQYHLTCDPSINEILIAFLSEYPFDTFQENDNGLAAYIPVELHNNELDNYLEELKAQFSFTYERIFIKAQNWNAVWESNFQPIIVDTFCGIRADFHAPISDVEHELIIQPKMAFGTGHHATTYQVIQMMQQIDFQGLKVLDYGSGTGILAILASKLGAKQIDAIDIDEWSKDNTLENATLNQVDSINTWRGDLSTVTQRNYDCVLANITFNVISNSLKSLSFMLSKKAHLICSGFFPKDGEQLKIQGQKLGLSVISESVREGWACLLFQK